jgi:putative oxidoreductase
MKNLHERDHALRYTEPGRWVRIAIWAIKGMVATAFLVAGYLKLSGQPKMVAEFGEIGLGQGVRYLTGGIEVTAAALLLVPRTAFVGAIALLGICFGALIAQLGPLHGDIVHVFVLGGLVALVAWINRR